MNSLLNPPEKEVGSWQGKHGYIRGKFYPRWFIVIVSYLPPYASLPSRYRTQMQLAVGCLFCMHEALGSSPSTGDGESSLGAVGVARATGVPNTPHI